MGISSGIRPLPDSITIRTGLRRSCAADHWPCSLRDTRSRNALPAAYRSSRLRIGPEGFNGLRPSDFDFEGATPDFIKASIHTRHHLGVRGANHAYNTEFRNLTDRQELAR